MSFRLMFQIFRGNFLSVLRPGGAARWLAIALGQGGLPLPLLGGGGSPFSVDVEPLTVASALTDLLTCAILFPRPVAQLTSTSLMQSHPSCPCALSTYCFGGQSCTPVLLASANRWMNLQL